MAASVPTRPASDWLTAAPTEMPVPHSFVVMPLPSKSWHLVLPGKRSPAARFRSVAASCWRPRSPIVRLPLLPSAQSRSLKPATAQLAPPLVNTPFESATAAATTASKSPSGNHCSVPFLPSARFFQKPIVHGSGSPLTLGGENGPRQKAVSADAKSPSTL